MKRIIVLSFMTILLLSNVFAQKVVTLEQAQTLIEKKHKLQIVDVRTQKEYDAGHLNKATLIDVKDADFKDKAEKQLNKKRPILVYCKHGIRSTNAAKQLTEMGFKKVYNMTDGYDGWSKRK